MILICYDGSNSAKHAVEIAHSTLGHMPMTLLHVWNPPAPVLADAFSTKTVESGPSAEDLERVVRERAQEILREGENFARDRGLETEGRLERNDAATWRTILNAADQVDAELIVLGTHGTTAVESGPELLGSVSAPVVHHSRRPLLIVPMPARAS